MASGLQCFDAAGRLMFNSNDRLARVLGIYTLPDNVASSGTFSDTNLLVGEPFAVFYRTSERGWPFAVKVTIAGTVMTWKTAGAVPYVPQGYIMYGVR